MDKKTYIETMNTEYTTSFFWRDVCVEFLSTFLLMSVQCSLALSWKNSIDPNPGYGNIVMVCMGMGFVVCALAWTFGDFGGCHMNPAVTLASVICVQMTFLKGLFYTFAQCAGAVAGAAFIYAVTPDGNYDTLAATVPHPDIQPWQAVLIETWITFILICTIMGSSNARRKGEIFMPTIFIGFVVTACAMSGSGFTGGSMNPVRSLGPAVLMNIWVEHWVYWVGPCLGAALASLVYHYILDRIGDMPDSYQAAKQDFDSLEMETIVGKKVKTDISYGNGDFDGAVKRTSVRVITNSEYL